MATVTEVLSKIDDSDMNVLVRNGIISTNTRRDLNIYNSFLQEYKKTNSKMQAWTNVAGEYGVNEMTVRRAIMKFSK